MENKIVKAENLPFEEKVYLKKGFMGWKVVYPIKNEDGTTNLKNLISGGSWWNLIIILVIILMILGAIYEYSTNLNNLLDCFRVPGKLEICKQLYAPELYNVSNLLG